jgi:hypothetical protein
MTITYGLAPNPKWYISDLVGKPLGGGYLATYENHNKGKLKLVYQDPAGNFPWSYVPIPNTSLLGIHFDENGAQGPFYFSSDSTLPEELYYLEVYDTAGNLQWTIDNFSPSGGGGSVVTTALDLQNLVVNSHMYNNVGFSPNPITNTLTYVAPSAHQGFAATTSYANPDIILYKSVATAQDYFTFPYFTLGESPFINDIAPAQYFHYVCPNVPTSETSKYLQIPIAANVRLLSNTIVTVTLWARATSGASTLQLTFRQFFGDGTSASTEVITPISTLTLTSSWAKYTQTFTIPTVAGKVIGECGNTGLFLQINYPLNLAYTIDIAKPSLFIGNVSPDQTFDTLDITSAQIETPRTGDIRQSFNYSHGFYAMGGWIFVSNTAGSIGSPSSVANIRSLDTFPLYNLIWLSVDNMYAPVYGTDGKPTVRGVSPIADYVANKALVFPLLLGRTLACAMPVATTVTKPFTVSGNFLIVDDTSSFYTGTTVTLTTDNTGVLPSNFNSNDTYYVIRISDTELALAASLDDMENSVYINPGSSGTPFMYLVITLNTRALGQFTGEQAHTQLIPELALHNHPGSFQYRQPQIGSSEYAISANQSIDTAAILHNIVIAPQGESVPFNVEQPTTYVNYMIKL